MNGLRPPLTAPPGFAVRQSRSDSKECCRPALLFREGEFPWQTRKPIKNISSAGTTPLARLLSAVPDSVRPCRNYVELHIILLYFPAFCDTILILINFTAENSRWNINIFAKVFPAKSPQIHPTISEFAEWEWLQQIPNPLRCNGLGIFLFASGRILTATNQIWIPLLFYKFYNNLIIEVHFLPFVHLT